MTRNLPGILEQLEGSLVASVQAAEGSPIRDVRVIAALAGAALIGGARGLRLNGPEDIARIRPTTTVPIVGLHKVHNGIRNVITPDVDLAVELVAAGADLIAVDATREQLGARFKFVQEVADAAGRPVMADVSTFEEGVLAWENGAAVVGTTLSGYTPDSAGRHERGPDVALVAALAAAGIPTIAEGRYLTADHVAAGFDAGALAVVVGGAITDPIAITSRLVAATPVAGRLR